MEPKPDSMAEESKKLSLGCEGEEVSVVGNSNKKTIGVLEVDIHQARDIHNICIYHNQDVYAKIFLTDDPEQAASTQIVNGGGKNPVFNENLWVKVRTIECLLRCEVWMMSRIKNYMEDQLLGFALVPLCDVVAGNGKMSGEFALSSCDLFHSPAGFVQVTARYIGALPSVLADVGGGGGGDHEILESVPCEFEKIEFFDLPVNFFGMADVGGGDHGVLESAPCELEKIEFLDPKVMNENEMMVLKYLEISCPSKGVDLSGKDLSCLNLEGLTPTHLSGVANVGGGGIPDSVTRELEKIESPNSNIMSQDELMVPEYLEIPCSPKDTNSSKRNSSLLNMRPKVQTHVCTITPFGLPSGMESQTSEQIGSTSRKLDQTCPNNNLDHITQDEQVQTPLLNLPPDESVSLSIPQATQPASETSRESKSPSKEDLSSPPKHNTIEAKGAEETIPAATPVSTFAVPEHRVVQQEIIDMYTKSMQQFTESLAKMKLPVDIERETDTQNGKADSKSGNTVEKDMKPKCSKSSRVFYGSRAFF